MQVDFLPSNDEVKPSGGYAMGENTDELKEIIKQLEKSKKIHTILAEKEDSRCSSILNIVEREVMGQFGVKEKTIIMIKTHLHLPL